MIAAMGNQMIGIVAIVDAVLEGDDSLTGRLLLAQPGDQVLGFAGEHRAMHDLDPAFGVGIAHIGNCAGFGEFGN